MRGVRPPRSLVVTFELSDKSRAIIAETLGGAAEVVYLTDVDAGTRPVVLRHAGAILAHDTATELEADELPLIRGARLLQFTSAGIDWVPLKDLPPELPVACNGGASAEPMAEHALALTLAAAKRLFIEHGNLKRGEFNQFARNRMLRGATCGILGFGGVGVATARLMHSIGMRVHAINRRGSSEDPVDWIGRPDQLDELLQACDVLVIAVPLTRTTTGMIGARELALLKPETILVNLARGEIIDESALYAHLMAHPRFTACIDAWWTEPVRHGRFEIGHPFLDLPNVIGSPHNSAGGGVWRDVSLRRAVANCRRALEGETPLHLIGPEERMM